MTPTLGQLVALRYASCDLAPYRDSAGNLPPGWPNWQNRIEYAWDIDSAVSNRWLDPGWPQPFLTEAGLSVLTEADHPSTSSFEEFWTWFTAEGLNT